MTGKRRWKTKSPVGPSSERGFAVASLAARVNRLTPCLARRRQPSSNQPLPVMGVKQWSSRLTADQQDLLRTLPAPVAQRESVVVVP